MLRNLVLLGALLHNVTVAQTAVAATLAKPAARPNIVPIPLNAAGVGHPASSVNRLYPMDGISLPPLLRGERLPERTLVYELFDRRALVRGQWKILSMCTPEGTGDWQRLDLAHDPGELHNLAPQRPTLFGELKAAYEQYARTGGVIPVDAAWRYLAVPPAPAATIKAAPR